MAQVNAEVASEVTGWKRRDDPACFGDAAITDRCRTHRPVRIIKRDPPPGVGRNRGFFGSKNVSPGRAGWNEGPLSRLRRGRQIQHAEQNRQSWELSHSRAMGMRVSIEHADGNPDLVSVNHVNHGDIPYGQTGRTSGGAEYPLA